MMPGLVGFLQTFYEKLPLGIVSGGTPSRVKDFLREFNMKALFWPVVTPRQWLRGKPWPDMYTIAAAKMGIHPSECLVVGDSINDARAAQKAGMQFIGFRFQTHVNGVQSFEELITWLQKQGLGQ
jgi:HAD superfamily hydrolase (TIGR01549 family)